MNTQTKVFALFLMGIGTWCLGTSLKLELIHEPQPVIAITFGNKPKPIGSYTINNEIKKATECIFIIYQAVPKIKFVLLDIDNKTSIQSPLLELKQSMWQQLYHHFYSIIKRISQQQSEKLHAFSDEQIDRYFKTNEQSILMNPVQNFEPTAELYNDLKAYPENITRGLVAQSAEAFTIAIDPVAYTPTVPPKKVSPVQQPEKVVPKPLPITLATSLDMQNMKIDEDAKIISIEYSNTLQPIAIFNNGKETVPISWYRVTIDKNKKTMRVEPHPGDTGNRTITNIDDTALNKIEALSTIIFAQYLASYPKEQREGQLKIFKNSGLAVQDIVREARLAYLYNLIATIFFEKNFFYAITTLKVSEEAHNTIWNQIQTVLEGKILHPAGRSSIEPQPPLRAIETKTNLGMPSNTHLTVEFLRNKISITFASASQSVGSFTLNNITTRITDCEFSIYRKKPVIKIVLIPEDGTPFDSSKVSVGEAEWQEAYTKLYSFIKQISQEYKGSFLVGYSNKELDYYFEKNLPKISVDILQDDKDKTTFYNDLKNYTEIVINALAEKDKKIPTIAIDPIVYIPKIRNSYNLFRGPQSLLNYFSQKAAFVKENYITPAAKKLWEVPRREKIINTLTGIGLGAGAAYLYYLYKKPLSLSK
jgi:hypothetical protein